MSSICEFFFFFLTPFRPAAPFLPNEKKKKEKEKEGKGKKRE